MFSGEEQGKVQIYTGCGKGKSTAAFGLAMRAAGCESMASRLSCWAAAYTTITVCWALPVTNRRRSGGYAA